MTKTRAFSRDDQETGKMEAKCCIHILEAILIDLIYYFVDKVTARFSTWLLGDHFVKQLWQTAVSSKAKSVAGGHSPPYLFDFFNLTPVYKLVSSSSLLSHIHNKLVSELNKDDYLPRYIIIVLDKDLIEAVHFGSFGCKVIFEKTIDWLAKNLENTIETR